MDLSAEAERLRLDLLAVRVSAALDAAGVPHAVIKGPSTALWLYDPPRHYRDVDVLVPASAADRVITALTGVAEQRAGGVGEEAEHSLLLHSPEGFEVDIHVSLPTLPPPIGDRLWSVMSEHLSELQLDVGLVPVLDEPARCFVLCLHALNSGVQMERPLEDLRRARAQAPEQVWEAAREVARQLDAEDLMVAGLSLVEDTASDRLSPRARLHATGAPSAALGLERLAQAPLRRVPGMIVREILPTRGFMQHANPDLLGQPFWLLEAHLRRWRRLLRELPGALRAWFAARNPHKGPSARE